MGCSLQCPKCLGRLETIVFGTVEVDRCVCCKGIWFDTSKAEQLKALRGSEAIDIGDPEVGQDFNTRGTVPCPRCQVSMLQMLDLGRYSLWYEVCPQCHGMWLDAGEFKQYKANFPQVKFQKFLRQIFHP